MGAAIVIVEDREVLLRLDLRLDRAGLRTRAEGLLSTRLEIDPRVRERDQAALIDPAGVRRGAVRGDLRRAGAEVVRGRDRPAAELVAMTAVVTAVSVHRPALEVARRPADPAVVRDPADPARSPDAAGVPAPVRADEEPATVVVGHEGPARPRHPGPAPRIVPAPHAVFVRRPIVGDARDPDPAVAVDLN